MCLGLLFERLLRAASLCMVWNDAMQREASINIVKPQSCGCSLFLSRSVLRADDPVLGQSFDGFELLAYGRAT